MTSDDLGIQVGQGRLGHGREAVGADVMCNAKVFARQAIQEVAGDGLARCVADAVHKTVERRPVGRQVLEQRVDLRVVGHVAVENQRGVEIGREFGDAFLEAFTHIAECQFSTVRMA